MAKEEKEKVKPEIFDKFEKNIKEIMKIRRKPLLVMFYSDPAGRIMPRDIDSLENVFDDFLEKKSKEGFNELDLLIHTHGGHADTSYRIIQLVRTYCKQLNILVPTHAHSGGALIAFGANKIEMGRSATFSPIDVQISSSNEDVFSLMSIEKYIEFLEDTSKAYKIKDEHNKTMFVIEMTKKLVEEVCPSDLGELFRLRGLTELHAKTLLHNYMFKNNSKKEEIAQKIFSRFTKESPTHAFDMDYELVKESGLIVEKMDNKIYKLTKDLISMLTYLKRVGVICPFYPESTKQRLPFFEIFDVK